MKRISLYIIMVVGMILFYSACRNDTGKEVRKTYKPINISKKLSEKADYMKTFFIPKGYNQKVCFLIDYNIPSGKKRFFIWDIPHKKVLFSGLCCHGGCNESKNTPTPNRFSNDKNSGCTALGIYSIGNMGYSKYGNHHKYWLYGLEKTNCKAVSREIVLHSWEWIPDNEIYPDLLVLSDGCPTVSLGFFNVLDGIIKTNSKPILLYMFN